VTIRSRALKLSGAAQDLLLAAAVLGEDTEIAVAARCVRREPVECLSEFQEGLEVGLIARAGVGHFSDRPPIRADRVIDLADQADVAWCVKNSNGAVLALGRTRRIASPAQTLALTARDGGCSFPGCDSTPEWSERHHILAWVDGGSTDLDNLTLLCRYHHHNFEQRGWRCRLTADRLPAWIPPKWVDHHQRPIVHPRILIRRWNPQDPLPASDPPW